MRRRAATVLATVAPVSSVPAASGCGTTNSSPSSAASGVPCLDTQVDPHNCGTCGHDCLGGACVSGACVPLSSSVFASGQATPGGIAVDANNVYWVNRGSYSSSQNGFVGAQIMRCAKSGCGSTPTVLASGNWSNVTNVVVQGANVYWGGSGEVFACAINGCSGGPDVLWSGDAGIAEIAVEDASLYFDDPDSSVVHDCSIDGCEGGTEFVIPANGSVVGSPVPTGFSGAPFAIAVDEDNLYAATGGSAGGTVVACPRSGCAGAPRVVSVSVGQPFGPLLAVDATNVYFEMLTEVPTATGSVEPSNDLASIAFSPKDATASIIATPGTALIQSAASPSAIASDGMAVYLAEFGSENEGGTRASGAGRIAKCVLPSCSGMPATVQDYVNYPQGVAVDDTNVYWTDFGSGTDPAGSANGRVMFRGK